MKPVAIVTPWFGKDLKGGAEQFAWQTAHRLSERQHKIEVLTTCCHSFYADWSKNYYDEGMSFENNVIIRRFRVDDRLDDVFKHADNYLRSFTIDSLKIGIHKQFKIGIENIFVRENINSKNLYQYLTENRDNYQSFIFIPYLYGTTLNGLPIVKEKSFLQPCLHNEPYAYLKQVETIFKIAKGILFNSEGESILANRLYGPSIMNKVMVVGGGCEYENKRKDTITERIKKIIKDNKFILYIGKRDKTKNTDLIAEAFVNYKKIHENSNLRLVLSGPGLTNFGNIEYGIIDLEEIDENEKEQLLRNCITVFQPSQNESYSRTIMEAWLHKKPVAVHKGCLVTSIAVDTSNGGWLAERTDEWTHIFKIVDNCDGRQLNEIGENGFSYAIQHGLWENAITRYEEALNLNHETGRPAKIRKKKLNAIHQLTPGFTYGDAITNQTIVIRNYLRKIGCNSQIYSIYIDPKMSKETIKFDPLRIDKDSGIIYHHSIGSVLTDFAIKHPGPKSLLYHNITPHELIKSYNSKLSRELKEGREDLCRISNHFSISVGDSEFNAKELLENGFQNPDVLPIIIDPDRWNSPPNHKLMDQLQDGKTNIIFVSRIIPSKCQYDLIYAFSEYLAMDSDARLILIGAFTPGDPYCEYVLRTVKDLGIERNVTITRLVGDSDLQAYYRTADLFWSMSEHEGFGVPLIESFWFDIPVLAYKSSAVPETLGKAGIMFNSKDNLLEIAALVKILVRDTDLRRKLLKAQRKRREDFLPSAIYPKLDKLIDRLMNSN